MTRMSQESTTNTRIPAERLEAFIDRAFIAAGLPAADPKRWPA